MKRILLAILCLTCLNAKEGLFIGIGGSYGSGAKITLTGSELILNQKFNFSNSSFPKIEAVVGQENFFSENFGIRYYGNISYGFMFSQENRITNTGIGINLDLIFNLPLSEAFGLKFYGGLNAEMGLLGGKPIDEWKRLFDSWERGNFEATRSNLRYALAVNLGMHLLFSKHHILEIGTKIPLSTEMTLISYRSTITPNTPKSAFTLTLPPIDFSLKYIFVF